MDTSQIKSDHRHSRKYKEEQEKQVRNILAMPTSQVPLTQVLLPAYGIPMINSDYHFQVDI